MNHQTLGTILLAATVGGLIADTHAAPTILINDTFNDVSPTPGPTPSTRGISPAYPWYALQTGGNIEVANDTFGPIANDNNYRRRLNPTTGYLVSVTNLPTPVTMAVGDVMQLTFLFNMPARHQAREGFVFGLYNSNGTKLTADGQAGTANNDAGYSGLVGVSPSGGFGAGDVWRETGTDNSGIVTGGDRATLPTTTRVTGTVNSSATHSVLFRLELLAANQMRVTEEVRLLSNNSIIANIVANDSNPLTTFDQVMIGTRQQSTTTTVEWRVDNVQWTYTAIPEPATLGLLALSGGALLMNRRRA